jgi:hypothetical protein
MLNEAFNGHLRGLMVCMPGRIMAFDPETQRAQVQCGIRRLINGTPVTIPIITGVPVQFGGDNEWFFYHQITPGQTEGLIHFSQRAVDTWVNSGGVTTPVDFRMFSAKDAMFSPGYRSEPGAIPGFVNDGCGLSNYAGNVKLQLSESGVTVTVGSSVLTIDENGMNFNGSSFTHNGTNVGDTHVHPQDNDSDNNSQQPTGGPQ